MKEGPPHLYSSQLEPEHIRGEEYFGHGSIAHHYHFSCIGKRQHQDCAHPVLSGRTLLQQAYICLCCNFPHIDFLRFPGTLCSLFPSRNCLRRYGRCCGGLQPLGHSGWSLLHYICLPWWVDSRALWKFLATRLQTQCAWWLSQCLGIAGCMTLPEFCTTRSRTHLLLPD